MFVSFFLGGKKKDTSQIAFKAFLYLKVWGNKSIGSLSSHDGGLQAKNGTKQ